MAVIAWTVAGVISYGAQCFAQEVGSLPPVRIIVPTLAGSGIDFAARTIQEPLAQQLGRQVVAN